MAVQKKLTCMGRGWGITSSSTSSARPVTVLILRSKCKSLTLISMCSLHQSLKLVLLTITPGLTVWVIRIRAHGRPVASNGTSIQARERQLNLFCKGEFKENHSTESGNNINSSMQSSWKANFMSHNTMGAVMWWWMSKTVHDFLLSTILITNHKITYLSHLTKYSTFSAT